MIERKDPVTHATCAECLSPFPRAWLNSHKNGANKIGFKYFCSGRCQTNYFGAATSIPVGFDHPKPVQLDFKHFGRG